MKLSRKAKEEPPRATTARYSVNDCGNNVKWINADCFIPEASLKTYTWPIPWTPTLEEQDLKFRDELGSSVVSPAGRCSHSTFSSEYQAPARRLGWQCKHCTGVSLPGVLLILLQQHVKTRLSVVFPLSNGKCNPDRGRWKRNPCQH